MNIKSAAVLAAAVISFIFFTACAKSPEPSSPKPEVCYNGFLGLTVSIPAGWHTEHKNENNLTSSPDKSKDLDSLDLYGNSDDSSYEIELITLQNVTDSARSDHASLMLYADYAPGYSELEYLEYLRGFIGEQSSGEYLHNIIDASRETLAGHIFTKLLVKVTFPDAPDSAAYYEEYYFTSVNGAYFVAYINYWENEKSKKDAYDILTSCFKLEASASQHAPPHNSAEKI